MLPMNSIFFSISCLAALATISGYSHQPRKNDLFRRPICRTPTQVVLYKLANLNSVQSIQNDQYSIQKQSNYPNLFESLTLEFKKIFQKVLLLNFLNFVKTQMLYHFRLDNSNLSKGKKLNVETLKLILEEDRREKAKSYYMKQLEEVYNFFKIKLD